MDIILLDITAFQVACKAISRTAGIYAIGQLDAGFNPGYLNLKIEVD
jgi:hypothetical protein